MGRQAERFTGLKVLELSLELYWYIRTHTGAGFVPCEVVREATRRVTPRLETFETQYTAWRTPAVCLDEGKVDMRYPDNEEYKLYRLRVCRL